MDIRVTFDKFQTLPKLEQFVIVFTLGDFIETRTEGKMQVILYTVVRFFVELYFDPGINKIIKVNGIEAGENLNKYSKVLQGPLK